MNATEELPRGQQLLLQRLMAHHCMSNKEATRTFETLVAQGKEYMIDEEDEDEELEGNENGDEQVIARFMGQGISTLQEAFVSINKQLKPGFGLEIVTMVDTSGTSAKYFHAVVNTAADEVAKNEHVFSKSWNPHERAFVRLVMGALVDQNNNDDDDENSDDEVDEENRNKDQGMVGIRKADLINLRSEISGGFKVSLEQAERVISVLLDEQWLRISASSETNRRDSVQVMIELAPRSYMELYHYITGLGMAPDKLPQFLYHRA